MIQRSFLQVCPICADNLGTDTAAHFRDQHSQLLKVQRHFITGCQHCHEHYTNCAICKQLIGIAVFYCRGGSLHLPRQEEQLLPTRRHMKRMTTPTPKQPRTSWASRSMIIPLTLCSSSSSAPSRLQLSMQSMAKPRKKIVLRLPWMMITGEDCADAAAALEHARWS